MASFPPLRLVSSGRSPLGLICREVPSVSARSARLGADRETQTHSYYLPVIKGDLLLFVKETSVFFQPRPYFPHVFVSKCLMETTIFENGPVLRESAEAGSRETGHNVP